MPEKSLTPVNIQQARTIIHLRSVIGMRILTLFTRIIKRNGSKRRLFGLSGALSTAPPPVSARALVGFLRSYPFGFDTMSVYACEPGQKQLRVMAYP